ncbi:MAG: S8 family peptidase, partial [Candidatus Latescibacteria bacterium]|nr:S8 family peptidase [Candidatus Latescibacterota bacterium]
MILLLPSIPNTAHAAARPFHPALRDIRPGQAISERFLSRDHRGGLLVDLIIEGNVEAQLLRDQGIEVGTRVGRIMTARCPLPALAKLPDLPGVERVEAAERCVPSLDQSVVDVGVSYIRTTPPLGFSGETGAGVLVGVVDTGIDYSHPDFLHPDGSTRLVSIWDQTGSGNPPPSGFGYGTEWNPSDINSQIAGEIDADGHGSHVAGIAAGNGMATGNGFPGFTYVGVAPEADLCFVKTSFQTTAIADGVNYIFQKAASLGKQAVVNLSLGTQAGPHDGTSALDALINGLTGPGRIVVAAAGNGGEDRHHGQTAVGFETPTSMTLTVPLYAPAGGAGNDYLLFSGWYEGADLISVSVRTPGNATVGPVPAGANLLNQNTNEGYVNIYNATTSPPNGDHEIYIEIFDGIANKPPKDGTWIFTFTPVSIGSTGRVDMYLFDDHLGDGSLLATWDQGFVPGGVVESPGDADSVICAAAHATKSCWDSVDGTVRCWNPAPTLGDLAPFSSQGPRRDGVLKPDLSAPGLGVSSSLSSFAPFPAERINADGVHVNISGTSMAAPHVTGAAALLLSQPCFQNATPSQIKARLRSTARADAFTLSVPNDAWGYGKLDIADAVSTSLTATVPHPAKGSNLPPGKPDSTTVAVGCVKADSVVFSLSTDGGSTYPTRLGALY